MTLSTHIVTGAAVAKIFSSHPAEAFVIGWATHYILDSVRHWDYPLQAFAGNLLSPTETKISFNKFLIIDFAKILLDFCLGFFLIYVLMGLTLKGNLLVLIAGGIGGTVPDFLQGLYAVFKIKPLEWLQRFHHVMHSKTSFDGHPAIGVPLQICVMLIAGFFLFAPF